MKKKLPLIILILIVLAAGISLYIYYSGKGNDGKLVLSGNIEVTEPNVGLKRQEGSSICRLTREIL
jgi:hypothetical protein